MRAARGPTPTAAAIDEFAHRPWWSRPRAGAVLVVLAAVAVYANTLRNGFVYDDLHQVLEDPRIRGLGGLSDIFSSGVWSFKWGPSSYYRPMMQLSYLLTYQVAELSPWAYHLVNTLLHAGATLALYALGLRVLADQRRAALAAATVAALVFAVHPLHTEPVAWIAAVGDLQLALYGLLSILLYLRALDGRRWAHVGALACYALALLSKEPAVVLPAILLAVDLLWSRQRSLRDAVIRLTPFALLTVGYFVVRTVVLGGVAPGSAPGASPSVTCTCRWPDSVSGRGSRGWRSVSGGGRR